MAPEVRCPRDGALLGSRRAGGKVLPFRVDECGTCGGTWLDRGELGKMSRDSDLERIVRDYSGPARIPLSCPRDGTPLATRTLRDVTVDTCPECRGFWLDPGELTDAASAARDIRWEGGGVSLVAGLTPLDIGILGLIAPKTLARFQKTMKGP